MYTAIMYALVETGEEGENHFRICELTDDGWDDLFTKGPVLTSKGTPAWEEWSEYLTFDQLMKKIKKIIK